MTDETDNIRKFRNAKDRVNVNLLPVARTALNTAQEVTGLTEADVINRALQLYAEAETRLAAGEKLGFLAVDGETIEFIRFKHES